MVSGEIFEISKFLKIWLTFLKSIFLSLSLSLSLIGIFFRGQMFYLINIAVTNISKHDMIMICLIDRDHGFRRIGKSRMNVLNYYLWEKERGYWKEYRFLGPICFYLYRFELCKSFHAVIYQPLPVQRKYLCRYPEMFALDFLWTHCKMCSIVTICIVTYITGPYLKIHYIVLPVE